MIKVIIADDVLILRSGLKAILEQDDEIEILALAQNGKEAFELCNRYRPDVVLMDMRMPEFDGEYGIKMIKEKLEGIKVLVLTTFDDEETVSKAMAGGADGYILKEMNNENIIQSVKSVYSGVNVLGGNVYKYIQQSYTVRDKLEQDLTNRERDVIKLVVEGLDNKEIASRLYLAEGTVRNNISKILEKLKLKDRTQLAVYAIKNNLDK